MIERVIWVVLDSVGIGEMPDAAEYGDSGSDTLGNIAKRRHLNLPNLRRLGLGNLKRLEGLDPVESPQACYGRCALASPGKDTTTGHWEMCGILLKKPLPLYPGGFPQDLLTEYESRIGRRTLGNKAASGTEIIQELGDEHVRTGFPIVYTSADSVFQLAAHEHVVPLDKLYEMCLAARSLFADVGRVIARPFTGSSGTYSRTPNRKDFALRPPFMLLDVLAGAFQHVHAIGKISDIFLGRGISRSDKTKSNAEGMQKTLDAMAASKRGLIFVNLVDFDMLYGHRNDVEGYARALEEVDLWLPQFEQRCTSRDLVIVTADHGCDPTTASTDHSREYVPLLVFGPDLKRGVDLGTRSSLADIGQTVADVFGGRIPAGSSFLSSVS